MSPTWPRPEWLDDLPKDEPTKTLLRKVRTAEIDEHTHQITLRGWNENEITKLNRALAGMLPEPKEWRAKQALVAIHLKPKNNDSETENKIPFLRDYILDGNAVLQFINGAAITYRDGFEALQEEAVKCLPLENRQESEQSLGIEKIPVLEVVHETIKPEIAAGILAHARIYQGLITSKDCSPDEIKTAVYTALSARVKSPESVGHSTKEGFQLNSSAERILYQMTKDSRLGNPEVTIDSSTFNIEASEKPFIDAYKMYREHKPNMKLIPESLEKSKNGEARARNAGKITDPRKPAPE